MYIGTFALSFKSERLPYPRKIRKFLPIYGEIPPYLIVTVLFGNDCTEVKENYSVLCKNPKMHRLGSCRHIPFLKDISLTFKLEHSFLVGEGRS